MHVGTALFVIRKGLEGLQLTSNAYFAECIFLTTYCPCSSRHNDCILISAKQRKQPEIHDAAGRRCPHCLLSTKSHRPSVQPDPTLTSPRMPTCYYRPELLRSYDEWSATSRENYEIVVNPLHNHYSRFMEFPPVAIVFI